MIPMIALEMELGVSTVIGQSLIRSFKLPSVLKKTLEI